MNPIDAPFLSSPYKDKKPIDDLLEDGWFFDNLLDRRRMMVRCNSAPSCPSPNSGQEMMLVGTSCTETSSSTNKVSEEGDADLGSDLDRASSSSSSSSAPSFTGLKEQEIRNGEDESGVGLNKLKLQNSTRHSLIRAPSLPPCIGRKEGGQDSRSGHKLSKLTRQASLSSAGGALPPPYTSKGMTQNYSTIQSDRSQRIARAESMNQRKIRKSLSDLEIEEVQGFRDLGFTFDKEELTPSVINILPGLQDKDSDTDNSVRRPYLSEAWLAQSSPPPIPNWVVKKSTDDMKAHIKFWARAVASNVR